MSAAQPRLTQSKLSFREPLESDMESLEQQPTTSQGEEQEEESIEYEVSIV